MSAATLYLWALLLLMVTSEILSHEELHKRVDDLTREVKRLNTKVKELSETGFSYLPDNSILVFRLTAGIGTSAYEKYTLAGYSDDHLVSAGWNCGCRVVPDGFLPCDRHYRSRFLDLWPSALIDTVRVTVYAHGKEMAFVEFNGRGSTYTNWFSHDRVLRSSWGNLKTEHINYFSIYGDKRPSQPLARRFLINHYYDGCGNDFGWLVVVDEHDVCPWAQGSPLPAIIYSTASTYSNYNNRASVGRADVLTVSVKLRDDVDPNRSHCP